MKKRVLSLFSCGGGMDIGFEGGFNPILMKAESYLCRIGAIQGTAGTPHKSEIGLLRILPRRFISRNSMKRVH